MHGGCIVVAPPDDEAVGELLAEACVTAVLMEGPEIAGLLEVRSVEAKACLVCEVLNKIAILCMRLPLNSGFLINGV